VAPAAAEDFRLVLSWFERRRPGQSDRWAVNFVRNMPLPRQDDLAREPEIAVEAAVALGRDGWARCAIGMLPDEGDVVDCYRQLRWFDQRAQRYKPVRRRRARRAVAFAMEHLAAVAGDPSAAEIVRDFDA
jgi:hypothetical protein